jgi:sugar-phosphatase
MSFVPEATGDVVSDSGGLLIECTGVLFDCDGVLVDSDAAVDRAWSRWAVARGHDPATVLAMVHGRRSTDTVALLVEKRQQREALEQIDRFELEDADGVRAIAGAIHLTSAVPFGRWAVVTSGTRALARARLAAAGIVAPGVLVTADDVSLGKPDPEGYLAAAERLGVPPSATVVLEDAQAGVRAARAAGVGAVIGVGGRDLGSGPDVIVADLTALRWTGSGLRVSAAPS